jgi:hypothetical protein
MRTDKEYEELWGEEGEKISQLVRKYHFYTAWKEKNKELALDIAEKIRVDFNIWKAKQLNITNMFVRRSNGIASWWDQIEGWHGLIYPFEGRLEKDWHLMYCFHHNYKKARYEFVSLILGNY